MGYQVNGQMIQQPQPHMNVLNSPFTNSTKRHHYNTSSNLLPENPGEQLIDNQNKYKKQIFENQQRSAVKNGSGNEY